MTSIILRQREGLAMLRWSEKKEKAEIVLDKMLEGALVRRASGSGRSLHMTGKSGENRMHYRAGGSI